MSFKRTAFGLSNMHMFSRVDAIVLVEGGLSLSVQEVNAGGFSKESQDISFWRKCFSELGPQVKLQFRAVGSKPTLHEIALQVAEGNVSHVYVAMDRDFDNLLGRVIDSPKVLYTFGYSWENDVWTQEAVKEVFYTLCGICRNTTEANINEILATSFSGFVQDVRWATKADFLCVMHAIPFLPHKSPQMVISHRRRGAPPLIDREALRRCVRHARINKTARIGAGAKIRLDSRVDCCGHLVGAFGYSILVYLLKKFCKGTTYPRHLLDSIAIDKFFEILRHGYFQPVRMHYQRQLAA